MSDKKLIDRATMAYRRRCTRKGQIFRQPDKGLSGVEGDLVVLGNHNDVLVMYRITAKGLRYFKDTDSEGQPHV